jgi:hypothetical protein
MCKIHKHYFTLHIIWHEIVTGVSYFKAREMMKFWPLICLILLLSCSSENQTKESLIEEVKYTQSDINQCLEYQQKFLDRAFSVQENKKGIDVAFTKDVDLARLYLSKFDFRLGLTAPKSQLVQNILKQCDENSIKKFDQQYKELAQCTPLYSELNYFQALSKALQKNSWPVDLKLEGKRVALDYVRHFSEGSFPLLNRLVALSVLDELSVNQIVNKDLHTEIKRVMLDAGIYVESLRKKMNKDKGFNCASLHIIRDELNYSDQVAMKLNFFLDRI